MGNRALNALNGHKDSECLADIGWALTEDIASSLLSNRWRHRWHDRWIGNHRVAMAANETNEIDLYADDLGEEFSQVCGS